MQQLTALQLGPQCGDSPHDLLIVVGHGFGLVEILKRPLVVEQQAAHGGPLDEQPGLQWPQEQQAVALARSLRSKGYSLRAISDELAAAGSLNRAGRPLNPKSVRSMLAA